MTAGWHWCSAINIGWIAKRPQVCHISNKHDVKRRQLLASIGAKQQVLNSLHRVSKLVITANKAMFTKLLMCTQRRLPFQSAVLHMFAQLILPLLQQVGWHDNEGGLDGHRLPLVVVLLLQVVNRPAGRRGVGQDQHQAL